MNSTEPNTKSPSLPSLKEYSQVDNVNTRKLHGALCRREERCQAAHESLARLCRTLPYHIITDIIEFNAYNVSLPFDDDGAKKQESDMLGRFAADPERVIVCVFPSVCI